MACLIVTVDYELFGNGEGCVEPCVLRPARQMMKISERHGYPLTFFVEALEFDAMEHHLDDHRARAQLRNAVRSGHDIQLHLHPQWWQATPSTDGRWNLEMSWWRIGDIGEELCSEMVTRGKTWLEAVADSPGYRCLAFRAGGWCIQPSEHVLKVLEKSGFKIDSSVAPGARNATSGVWYDFRNTPTKPYWSIKDDVCKEKKGMLWEVPIATGRVQRMRRLRILQDIKKRNGGLAPDCMGSYRSVANSIARWKGQISKLARLGHVMLDVSTMPADVLIDVSRQWLTRFSDNEQVPLVAIAHTKNFTDRSAEHLVAYLNWARQEGIQCSTFKGWLEAHGA